MTKSNVLLALFSILILCNCSSQVVKQGESLNFEYKPSRPVFKAWCIDEFELFYKTNNGWKKMIIDGFEPDKKCINGIPEPRTFTGCDDMSTNEIDLIRYNWDGSILKENCIQSTENSNGIYQLEAINAPIGEYKGVINFLNTDDVKRTHKKKLFYIEVI